MTELKLCKKCGEVKPATREFFTPNGKSLHSHCKPCKAKYQRVRRIDPDEVRRDYACQARWRAKNPNYSHLANERRKWAPGMYAALVAHQGEQCAICETGRLTHQGRRLDIDHCHETGVVRGLLCNHCNLHLPQWVADGVAKALAYIANPPCLSLGFRSRSSV